MSSRNFVAVKSFTLAIAGLIHRTHQFGIVTIQSGANFYTRKWLCAHRNRISTLASQSQSLHQDYIREIVHSISNFLGVDMRSRSHQLPKSFSHIQSPIILDTYVGMRSGGVAVRMEDLDVCTYIDGSREYFRPPAPYRCNTLFLAYLGHRKDRLKH